MTNLILDPSIAKMLKAMEGVFNSFGVDYYVVGAVARDIQLSSHPTSGSIRKTADVDLAISISDEGHFKEMKAALIGTGNFTSHSTETIKLLYNHAIEVDLLPFGEIEDSNRNVKLTDPAFVLNMHGFKEIYPFVDDIQVMDDLTIKVCTMEGIILLKLIANNDRPQRTKDISDIEHIIKVYFDLYSGDIYEEHFDTMEIYDTNEVEYLQLVCCRVIGRKIRKLLINSEQLRLRIEQILAKRPTAWWQAMLEGMNDEM